MKTYKLDSKEIITENFHYAYSPHSKNVREFELRDGYIANFPKGNHDGYSYTSIISKETYTAGAKIHTKCAFERFGAPLIVFGNDMSDGENGMKLYGLHFEVVAYENGVNVWHIVPDPSNEERPIKPTLIASMKFTILPDEMTDITVAFGKGEFDMEVNGHKETVSHKDIPETFRVGITACEGPNKFYEINID